MERDPRRQILDQMIDPLSQCLTPDVARRVVDLRATAAVETRVRELADKCNEGLLTAEERGEYETYVLAGNLIAILQAKARRLLAGQNAA